MRRFISLPLRWWAVAVSLPVIAAVAFAASEKRPDSLHVYAYEFDRGNVLVQDVGNGYADKEPVILNAEKYPNTTEYDLDFPVTATYTFYGKYAAADSRPVDIFLDEEKVQRGFKSTTGSWNASTAIWEKQCEMSIAKGRHTVKLLCPGSCIPHIVAFRLDSSEPFPEGFKRKRKPISAKLNTTWSGKPEPGKYGYAAYVRQDGYVDAPTDYNPIVPYDRIPPPTPSAHRLLEYLLMGEGKYRVEAKVEQANEDDDQTGWVARLSVNVNDTRTDTAVLPLATDHIQRMLNHTVELIADFRMTKNKNYLATEKEAARKMLNELSVLASGKDDGVTKWSRVYDLHVRAYKLKNHVALSNPLLDFSKLLFVKRPTYDTSHIYTTYFDGSNRFGGNLQLLSPVRPDGQTTPLVNELGNNGIFRDPDLSWDGKRVIFSFKPDLPTGNQIYEVNVDGTGLHQLTNSEYDDIDPCYLPDGRIMFVSTRCRRVVLCHNAFTVSVLYTMDGDGSDIRCVSPNTVNDFTPSVNRDGQVVYTRWEYVDKQLGNNQSLWGINPDGTGMFHLAGEHWGPITLWEPRQVPKSSLLVCTLAPHMPIAVGPIALIDPADRCASPAKFTNLTPELPPPHHFGWHRTDVGYYCNPFPLSEKYFVVSYAYGPGDRERAGYGLYLLDKWNNRDLLYRDPDISCFEAFPVKPRPRPTVLPPAQRREDKTGTLYLVDVYKGLTGVERGSVKYLRILEDIPKPVSANCSGGCGLQYPLMSNYGHYTVKRVWGTVPVEADGSAYFKAPADKAVFFSALDENFMEVQRMRTFTSLAPGQSVTCVGCHEHRQTSPPNKRALAVRRSPSEITPPPDGAHAPDFYYDVQPVLNRHCVRCHDSKKTEGGIDLSPDYTNSFNVAYETLTGKGYVSYVNILQSSSLPLRPAKYYGSYASKLPQLLLTTHKKYVELPKEDFVRIVTWIDCNAPYYGTYLYNRPGTVGGRELLTPTVRASLDGLYAKRCASCHGQDPARIQRISFTKVESSPALLAPLAKADGGTEACGKPVFADRQDPDFQLFVSVLRQLEAEMRTKPREDMLPTRPPMFAEKSEYRFR
ncbi:MAG: hypothetical protein HY318_11295 [Armatimonadetes bacterium]|nr:hypothetical protein [Armatimonadota bacterium]